MKTIPLKARLRHFCLWYNSSMSTGLIIVLAAAVLLLAGFGTWYIRKLRKAPQSIERKKEFLDDADQFATRVIKFCDTASAYITDQQWEQLKLIKEHFEDDIYRLAGENPFGNVLAEPILKAVIVFRTVHGVKRYDEEKVKKLRQLCEHIKDVVNELREKLPS